MPLRIETFGPHALLVRFEKSGDEASFAQAQILQRHLDERAPPGLLEVTPGFRTLLLEYHPGTRPEPPVVAAALASALKEAADPSPPSRTVEIPTVYDGPDLQQVARHTGLEPAEIIRRHTAATYRVQILGFAPGFAYLSGLDRKLRVPRLAAPRPHVPAGSVAIGGEHTGVYPVATAGGWNLIGRTSLRLIDPAAAWVGKAEAFLLRPGDAVRFVSIVSSDTDPGPKPDPKPGP